MGQLAQRPRSAVGRKVAVKAILFDIGNVLLFFDHGIACRRAAALCRRTEQQVRQMMFASRLVQEYEEGRLMSAAFIAGIRDALRLDAADEEIREIWCDIFCGNERVLPLVERLASAYRLVLLSNTNEMHMEFIRERFPALGVFHGAALSYEVGHLKPSRAIFEHAIAQAAAPPSECVYIDDVADYCETGRALGLHAIHYTPDVDLWAELAAL